MDNIENKREIEAEDIPYSGILNDVLLSQSGLATTIAVENIKKENTAEKASSKAMIESGAKGSNVIESGVITIAPNVLTNLTTTVELPFVEGTPEEFLRNRQNVCHVCNKQFFYLYALKRHLNTHSSAQVLSCNQCTKVFKHQSTLIQHKATHSQNQPFACDLCPKSFNRISTLTSHRRTHSGVKPFICHICNKGFHQKGNLKNHLYIHTNERPYRCHICNKGFNQMSNLVCHKRNAHCVMQSTYSCLICNLTFQKRDNLRSHEQEVHFKNKNHLNQAAVAAIETKAHFGENFNTTKDTTIQMGGVFDSHLDVPALNNCQMIFERTKNHFFFSKYSVIELPEKIDTLEMRYAENSNKIPFAVLHFNNQHPSLVQIVQQKGKSVLKPIKKQDLGRFSISMDNSSSNNNNNGNKIVITIVASIYQTFVQNDFSVFTVKSPEVVRFVKLLIDDDVNPPVGNCVQDQELKELKNKITIATSDSKAILDSIERGESNETPF